MTTAHTYRTSRTDTDNLWEAMATQRAVRYWEEREVPDDLIWRVIEAGTRAPSGSNRQPWGFVAIQDRGRRERIAQALRSHYEQNEAVRTHLNRGAASPDKMERLMLRGARTLFKDLAAAPVFIIPCLHNPQSPTSEGLLAGSSIYQAVQNMLLAARGLGLGTVMTTFHAGIEPLLREMLELPDNATPVALIPIGWPAVNFGPVNRKPVEQVTHWETWGRTRSR